MKGIFSKPHPNRPVGPPSPVGRDYIPAAFKPHSTGEGGPTGRLGWVFRGVYLCFSLYISVSQLFAQQASTDDHAPVQVRRPNPAHLRDLQTARAYQYGHEVPPPENPIARFLAWLWGKISEFLSSEAYENVWQYVILAVITGLVIYLLRKANVLEFLFPKKAQSNELDYETLTENIHEIDFDAATQEAIDNRNFRLAVRLLYLQTLKHLTNAGHIDYKPDKTNGQYVYELANSPLRADFERLTRQFEFVWYGDVPVDDNQFATIRDAFGLFKDAIDLGRREPHLYGNDK